MAGTVTTTEVVHGIVKKVTFAWTSSAGGAADATTTKVYDGKIVGVATIPSGGGTAPTTLYDVAINDADGHDVLLGAGADRSATVTEFKAETVVGAIAGSALTLAVTNAGASKQGTVIVWVR